ncbi:hypothetical protein BDZ91DRAFT_730706 [Kalaharituber pfeilii]|nr:hypothetical protein BDZ91DRAFT_730706 [Kalaharituber pfeilii]
MSSPPPIQPSITPPSLFSLAIYNPSLGPTDETVNDQIVFYTSQETQTPNDRLRQVGLAQGVVEFARGFSKKENLSHIETERSRILLHEVESEWWILAHIDFTRINSGQPDSVEYSSRELSQPALLLSQLLSAYNQYRFLYGTFSENLQLLGREKFCRRLERYWKRWAWRWDVMPVGNPAVEVWGGIKIAQPRLGAAVAEVLEAFAAQERAVEGGGFVDIIVSRFGKAEDPGQVKKDGAATASTESQRTASTLAFSLWPTSTKLSPSQSPRTQSPARPPPLLPVSLPRQPPVPREFTPSDGCIFPGTGQFEPVSVRDITVWASNVYLAHEDKPGFGTRKKKQKRQRIQRFHSIPNIKSDNSLNIDSSPSFRGRVDSAEAGSSADIQGDGAIPVRSRPRSLIAAHRMPQRLESGNSSAGSYRRDLPQGDMSGNTTMPSPGGGSSIPANGKLLNILTFGWAGAGNTNDGVTGRDRVAQTPVTTETNVGSCSQPGSPKVKMDPVKSTNQPRFLYGFTGNLDEDEDDGNGDLGIDDLDVGSKITEKYVWLVKSNSSSLGVNSELNETSRAGKTEDIPQLHRSSTEQTLRPSTLKEYRLVVYLNPPFTIILIFEPNTPRLSSPSFYRSLHLRLGPLRSSLLPTQSTKPATTATPKSSSPHPKPTVYDFLFDPFTLHLSSSIPNIPLFSPFSLPEPNSPWTRLEAIHVHNQILNLYVDSNRGKERKSRTTRGWWLAWSRLGSSRKEAILVWKAGETSGTGNAQGELLGMGRDIGAGGAAWGVLDTRRYFEGLLRGRG